MTFQQPNYEIVTIRREIEAKAHAERIDRALDIATTRLAWCLQQFPEVAQAYDRAWREP